MFNTYTTNKSIGCNYVSKDISRNQYYIHTYI